jgi:type IV pilus assembly protein PilZ
MSDLRDNARQPITLRVDYKRVNMFFSDYTKNISKGGTFIKTKNPLPIGTEFVFVMSFPGVTPTLELAGEVVWIAGENDAEPSGQQTPGTSREPGEAGMGIKFKFTNDGERERVARFVEGMMTERLGQHISSKLLQKT